MGTKLQPVILGGVLIGVLASLPYVSTLNGCCCLWVLAGGVLTTYLLQERSPLPVTAGEAAVSGLLAGVIGAIIASVIGATLLAVLGGGPDAFDSIPRGDMPPEMSRIIDRFRELTPSFWSIGPFFAYILSFP